MEVLAAMAVMPACVGLALLLQIGTLRIILWALQPLNDREPAPRKVTCTALMKSTARYSRWRAAARRPPSKLRIPFSFFLSSDK